MLPNLPIFPDFGLQAAHFKDFLEWSVFPEKISSATPGATILRAANSIRCSWPLSYTWCLFLLPPYIGLHMHLVHYFLR